MLIVLYTTHAHASITVKLDNGQSVIIENSVKTYLRDGVNWVLVIKYVTKTQISEVSKIKAQANLILDKLKNKIEETEAKSVVFTAFNKKSIDFGVSYRESYSTVFELTNKKWVMYNPESNK